MEQAVQKQMASGIAVIDHPQLKSFAAQADKSIAEEAEHGFHALENALHELVFSFDLLQRIAQSELAAIQADHIRDSGLWDSDHLLIANGKGWQLRVGLYSRNSQFIYTLPFHMMVAVIVPQPLRSHLYKIPEKLRNEHFDPSIQLDRPKEVTTNSGELLVVNNRVHILDVIVDRPILAVKFTSNINDTLHWAFDRETGKAVQAIAASVADSELVSMARALGAMKRTLPDSKLYSICQNRTFFVRWAALQALARVEPERAIEALRVATQDPHPHVAAAAKQALAQHSRANRSRTGIVW